MTYDYDKYTADGERHLATAGELEDAGFAVYEAPEQDAVETEEPRGGLDALFDGGPDLETPEGCEQALAAIRQEIRAGLVI